MDRIAPQSTTTSIAALEEGALKRDNNNRTNDKMETRMGTKRWVGRGAERGHWQHGHQQ